MSVLAAAAVNLQVVTNNPVQGGPAGQGEPAGQGGELAQAAEKHHDRVDIRLLHPVADV